MGTIRLALGKRRVCLPVAAVARVEAAQKQRQIMAREVHVGDDHAALVRGVDQLCNQPER